MRLQNLFRRGCSNILSGTIRGALSKDRPKVVGMAFMLGNVSRFVHRPCTYPLLKYILPSLGAMESTSPYEPHNKMGATPNVEGLP